MSLNKKGLTILELIITMSLISIVIIFLYSLLVDINNELTNNNFAINNQANRYEIIKYIQDNLSDSDLYEVTFSSDYSQINFRHTSGTSSIRLTDKEFTFTDKYSITTKWEMIDSTIGYADTKICYSVIDNNNILLNINIPIYNTNDQNKNKDNNNITDDISLSYIGKYENIASIEDFKC